MQTITIEAQDVEAAVRKAKAPNFQYEWMVKCCPVYQALKRLGYPVLCVAHVDWSDTEGNAYKLPAALQEVTARIPEEWAGIETPISVEVDWTPSQAAAVSRD